MTADSSIQSFAITATGALACARQRRDLLVNHRVRMPLVS